MCQIRQVQAVTAVGSPILRESLTEDSQISVGAWAENPLIGADNYFVSERTVACLTLECKQTNVGQSFHVRFLPTLSVGGERHPGREVEKMAEGMTAGHSIICTVDIDLSRKKDGPIRPLVTLLHASRLA
jgi:hypothetical protein